MYCLRCNYDLSGLDTNRCPECGRGFNPADPATFQPHSPRQRAGSTARETIIVIAELAAIYLFIVLLGLGFDAAIRGAFG